MHADKTRAAGRTRDRKTHPRAVLYARARAHRHSRRGLCRPRELHRPAALVPHRRWVQRRRQQPIFACLGRPDGFIYFLYMFALAARLAFDPLSRSLRFRAILYAAMGAASSMYFMYLQLAFIREVCSYCLIAAVTTFLLLIAALWHLQATRKPAT